MNLFNKQQLKTVDSVLAVFTKTADELKAVAVAHTQEAERQAQIAEKAAAAKQASEVEVSKATNAIEKIQQFLA